MAVASQSAMITGFSMPGQVAGAGKCSTAVKLSSFGANLSSFTAKYRLIFSIKDGDKRNFSAPNARAAVKVQSTGRETGNQKSEEVLRVALICGGPSAERGISLNSARSVLDHIQAEDLSVSCYYIDCQLNAYAISSAQMYSNTPADFDFKLDSLAQGFKSLAEFMDHLAVSTDIVFPLIHGKFGEDGSIQELIEKAGIPFVGTGSREARLAFDKYNASMVLNHHKFVTIPSFLVQGISTEKNELSKWFAYNGLDINSGKVVVKPTCAGSSIGVDVAFGVNDALIKANILITEGVDDRIIIETFIAGGKEFTAIVLDVGSGSNSSPVTLLPTEVELQFHGNSDAAESGEIFNYRRKYLPTQQIFVGKSLPNPLSDLWVYNRVYPVTSITNMYTLYPSRF